MAKIQFHRIDTNVVVGLLVREFCCPEQMCLPKSLAMYAGTELRQWNPVAFAAGLSQVLSGKIFNDLF